MSFDFTTNTMNHASIIKAGKILQSYEEKKMSKIDKFDMFLNSDIVETISVLIMIMAFLSLGLMLTFTKMSLLFFIITLSLIFVEVIYASMKTYTNNEFLKILEQKSMKEIKTNTYQILEYIIDELNDPESNISIKKSNKEIYDKNTIKSFRPLQVINNKICDFNGNVIFERYRDEILA